MLDEIKSWIKFNEVETSNDHFYLQGDLLDNFSKFIISKAERHIIVVNPYVERCNLTNSLVEASKRGVFVQLITRRVSPQDYNRREKEGYLNNLMNPRFKLIYNDSVHAKLIIVDNSVTVVSSLNFTSSSSSGKAWESGIVSKDLKIVKQVVNSLSSLIDSRETLHQEPIVPVNIEKEISFPPDTVFFYLTDDSNIPLWMKNVEKIVREPDAPLQVGSFQTHYFHNGDVSRKECIDFKANQTVSLKRITDSFKVMEQYELKPTEKGTKINVLYVNLRKNSMDGYQISRMRKRLEKYYDQVLENLKKICEKNQRGHKST